MDVILTYQGAPGDLIKAAVDNGAKGVVIAGAGAGATSGTQGEGISYATEKGAFIVSTTRTGAGSIGGGARRPPPQAQCAAAGAAARQVAVSAATICSPSRPASC